jgi:hypothetical protein
MITPLTADQREDLKHQVAYRWLDQMSMKDLERVFVEMQVEHLDSCTDEELLAEIEDNFMEAEFASIMEGLANG